MLSPEDRRVAEADPGLPGLAALLDPEELLHALRLAAPMTGWNDLAVDYLRYKPGTSCLTGFLADTDRGPVQGYVVTHPPAHPDKLRLHRRDRAPSPVLGTRGVRLDDLPAVARALPNDAELRGIKRVWQSADAVGVTPVILRYKPERRLVARIDRDQRATVIKLHTPSRIVRALAGAAISSRGFRTPRLFGYDATLRMLVFEWVDGRVLADVQAETDGPDHAVRVGRALAALHQTPTTAVGDLRRASPTAATFRLAEQLTRLLPSLGPTLRDLAPMLVGACRELGRCDHLVHGDFYAKQVLVSDEGVTLLDFDQARLGDPMEDLGRFHAHLQRDVLRGRIEAEQAERLWDGVRTGYGRLDAEHELRLHAFEALATFELAQDPFRHRDPAWAERTTALVLEAEARLAPVVAGVRASWSR